MSSLELLGAKFVSKFLTMVFTAFFSVCSISGGVNKEPASAPEDFTPVLRFAVCSDVHLDGEEDQRNAKEFAQLFTQCYEYSEKHGVYKNLDAVMVCGDMTEWGREKEYQSYYKIVKENLREGTQMLECMGNHEFIEAREVEGIDPFKNYAEYVNEEFDTHTVINGYHFIGLSYSDKDENYDESKLSWLKAEIEKAIADTGDKPVFVFQHPHPALTVYGSINWGDLNIRKVLSKYPQVVNFSGHSHYNPIDPRSVWQGSFTALGTGAVTGLIGNTNYLDGGSSSTVESASYYIVEVDVQGNIKILTFDAHNDVFFPEGEIYLEEVHNSKNHIYTWKNMKSFDTKPSFPENSEITAEKNKDGEAVISFPDAKGYYDAVSYNIAVKDERGKTVYVSSVVSDYVVAEEDGMKVNLGALSDGKYTVTVEPVSPYAKTGEKIKGEIEI